MSGGSLGYLYLTLEDTIGSIRASADPYVDNDLREAFKAHLRNVARTLKAIEWNDSGDGDPDERELIRRCLRE